MNWLKGKKTYLAVAAIFAVGGLKAIGVLDETLATTILSVLAGLGLTFARVGAVK